MKYVCHYAIAHFLPYIETGEFANVGVVLLCPEQGRFEFLLLKKGKGRITDFFDKLDPMIFLQGKNLFEQELARIRDLFMDRPMGKEAALALFGEVIRPREALFRFDTPRVILADDPKQAVADLFGRYVEHGFATKQYQEDLFRRNVHQLLKAEKLEKIFTATTIGPDDFQVPFPFVHREQARAVIKPLFLAQKKPTKVYEHGGIWINRLERLRKKRALPPRILFTIEEPMEDAGTIAACHEVEQELRSLGALVIKATETSELLAFARQ